MSRVLVSLFLAMVSCLGLGVRVNGHGHGDVAPIPAFFWSGKDLFGGKNNLYAGLEGISQEALVDMVKDGFYLSHDLLKDIGSADLTQVDLRNTDTKMIVFLTDRLAATDISVVTNSYSETEKDQSISFLRSAVLHSKASVVLPYVIVNKGPANPFELNRESSVMFTTPEDVVSPDFDFAKKLSSHKVVMIVVGHTFTKEADDHIREVCEKVGEIVGDDYVALLTSPNPNPTKSENESPVVVESRIRILADDVGENNTTKIRNNPNLMSAMLVSLLLLLMTAVYICCIDCVEPPSGFASRYPYKGKEFN
mmetsp:Transcript_12387/g.15361  ORF Transcript_12387/g.15361 Transcript_12387/m.15361 type:complete len:309 (-) Transcript_12387:201-1127(-)